MRRCLLPLLVLCWALPASAQVSADPGSGPGQVLAEAYLEASGLPARVGEIGDQIAQQIQVQAGQFPEPAQGPFREIYGEALGADALAARLRAYVAAEGDADSLRAALAWYEQPLVARMQALEDSASTDDNAQVAVQMYAMTGSFASTEITPEREAQTDRFLAATGGTDAAVDLYLDIIVASQGATSAVSGEDAPPADSVRAQMRPMLESNVGGAIRGSTLYAYRDVADADLDAFIALLETPAGQYATRLNREAVSAALVGAITDAGEAFAQTLLKLDAEGAIDLDEMRASDG